MSTADPTTAAGEPPAIDTGDNAWMLTSSALVLFMTAPGLALFYSGLVRKKNGAQAPSVRFFANSDPNNRPRVIGFIRQIKSSFVKPGTTAQSLDQWSEYQAAMLVELLRELR